MVEVQINQAPQSQCILILPDSIVTLIISKYWFPELTLQIWTSYIVVKFSLIYRLEQI